MAPRNYAITSLCLATSLLAGPLAVSADPVQVWFLGEDALTAVPRALPATASPLEATLEALAAGPTAAEAQAGLTSALPAGTRIASVTSDGERLQVDFSKEILAAGVGEIMLEQVYRQVRWTVHPFHSTADLVLTVDGQALTAFLPPVPRIQAPPSPAMETAWMTTGALSGRSLTLSPGHGYYWNGGGWVFQRPDYCLPLSNEDLHNVEICRYLETYLLADGMTVKPVRCTDQNYGKHPVIGKDWWQLGAYMWLQHVGYPCGVYAPFTGDCLTGSGSDERDDDIRSRPLASDYDNTDIYISIHTNGYQGNCTGPQCPTGTETYYDASPEHAAWGPVSEALANNVSDGLMNNIVAYADSTWTCTTACVKNSNGAYGEIRIPDRAAILVELGYHDTCDRDADANHLRDSFFRSAMMWGVYQGVCDYFGTSPTWGFHSCEYVSDTLPFTMAPGETRNVTITLRNRGVLWKAARNFALGAVGDSDPMTALTRINLTGEIGPGQTFTFSFDLTAPATPGYYTTDWQMVRDGYGGFGPMISRQIQVGEPPTEIFCDDFDGYDSQAAMEAVWTWIGNFDRVYQLDQTFGNPGQSVRMDGPAVSGLGKYYHNLGATYAGSEAEPLVFEFDMYVDAAAGSNARQFCEIRGYSGGAYGSGTLETLVAIGLYDNSGDPYSSNYFQGRVPGGGWYTLDGPGAPTRTPGWHRLAVKIVTNRFDFYVDGVLAESVSRTVPAGFDCIVLGSNLSSPGSVVWVDNLCLISESQPPIITRQPGTVWACPGATTLLSIDAIGAALNYQWQLDGSDLTDDGKYSGVQTPSLSIAAFGPADLGEYRCVVRNEAGTVTSEAPAITIRELPAFVQHPAPAAAAMGGSASFAVSLNAPDPVTYQWQRNGQAVVATSKITGVDGPLLNITDVRADNVGAYTCAITGPCGTIISNAAALSLTTVPGDYNGDSDVDMEDFAYLQACLTGVSVAITHPACTNARLDQDNDLDAFDVEYFQACLTGPGVPGTPACAAGQ